MNKNTCNNCGKIGHLFHQCKLPITSYGIIAFKSSSKGIKYLMIRRKDTFGYIDFIRGKYSPYNIEQVKKTIDEMSNEEKKQVLENSFDELWKNMWGTAIRSQYRNEESISSKKFEIISNGLINDTFLVREGTISTYILQKINTSVFKNVNGLVNNLSSVLPLLRHAAYAEIRLIKTKKPRFMR